MGLHKCYARYLIKPNKMKSEEEVILKAKELINNFDAWKGHLEQVDDVCVVGIKL